MKKVRVFYNGTRQKDMYPYHNWAQRVAFRIKLFFKRLIALSIVGLVIWGVAEAYRYVHPVYITEVQAKEIVVDPAYPVMQRIAKAESLDSHYCTDQLIKAKMCAKSEKGQVLVRANKNKTIDVGRYQVNVFYWGSKATELGYDIFNEEDNEKMAMWIYKNHGTDPWYSSAEKW